MDGVDVARLSQMLGATVTHFEVVDDSLRAWPQSSSALLRLHGEGVPPVVFAKITSPDRGGTSNAASLARDLQSNRAEARYYTEFVPLLKARGVPCLSALAADVQLDWLDEWLQNPHGAPPAGGTLLILEPAPASLVQPSPLAGAQVRASLDYLAQMHAALSLLQP